MVMIEIVFDFEEIDTDVEELEAIYKSVASKILSQSEKKTLLTRYLEGELAPSTISWENWEELRLTISNLLQSNQTTSVV